MAASLVVLPVVWPLLSAIAVGVAPRAWQRQLCLAAVVFLLGIDIAMAMRVADGSVLIHNLGAWPAPFGIVLVADRLAAILLLLTSVTAAVVLLYEAAAPDPTTAGLPFFPLFLFLLMGLNGAFVTGDLFNLFVFFEILLISSYVLLTLGASERQLRVGLQFVVLNLASSALFLLGVGILYGITGTLNFADLALRIPRLPADSVWLLHVAITLLLVVFATKSALLPFAFWLPDAYPAAPIATAAMFGGIATKVGVYAMLRVFTTAFAEVRGPAAEVMVVLGSVSMIIGVLAALAQTEMRRLLSFHIISQIGYLVLGIGLFTAAGIGAALFYLVHYTLVKCALFLISGVAERLGSGNIKKLGGLAHRSPMLGVLFFVAGISLAGLPPSSGFVSKLLLISAALTAERYLPVAIAFVAGLLTLFSMMKIWTMAFWGVVSIEANRHPPRAQLAAVALLVSFSVTLALTGERLSRFTQATAVQVLDTRSYVVAVLGSERTAAASPPTLSESADSLAIPWPHPRGRASRSSFQGRSLVTRVLPKNTHSHFFFSLSLSRSQAHAWERGVRPMLAPGFRRRDELETISNLPTVPIARGAL